MIKYHRRNSLEYTLRQISNLEVELVHEHENVHADYRVLSNQTQVSLVVIPKQRLTQLGVTEDVVALQVKDDSKQTKALGPVWRFSRVWEISTKKMDGKAIPALKDITSRALDIPALQA